jgi:hypothetical protein
MPVGRRFDFQLAGKGYILVRGEYKGRAWSRTGRSDAPGVRSQVDARWGVLEDEPRFGTTGAGVSATPTASLANLPTTGPRTLTPASRAS